MKRYILAITSISLLLSASCSCVTGGGGGAAETCILSPEATEILPASIEDGSLCGGDLQRLDSAVRPWSMEFGDRVADGLFLIINESALDDDISRLGLINIPPRGRLPITFRGFTPNDSLVVTGDTINFAVEFDNEWGSGRVAVRFEANVTGCDSQLLTGPRVENVFQLAVVGSVLLDGAEFPIAAGTLSQTSKRTPGPCDDALRPLTDQRWMLRTTSEYDDEPETDVSLSFSGATGFTHFANVSVPGVELGCDEECPATSISFDGDTLTFEAAFSETASVSFVGQVTDCRDDLYLTYLHNRSELVVDGEGTIEVDGVEFPLTRLHFGKTDPVPPLRDLCSGDRPSFSCILNWTIRTTDPRIGEPSGVDPVFRALGQRSDSSLFEVIDPRDESEYPARCDSSTEAPVLTFDGERLTIRGSSREQDDDNREDKGESRTCTVSFDGVLAECTTFNDGFVPFVDRFIVRFEGQGQTVFDGVVTSMNQLYLTGIPTDAPPPGPTGTIEDFLDEFPFLFP